MANLFGEFGIFLISKGITDKLQEEKQKDNIESPILGGEGSFANVQAANSK